jgi:hypothetical protein
MNQPVEWNDAQFGWSIQIYPDDTRRTRHWAHQLVAGTCSPCVKPPGFPKQSFSFVENIGKPSISSIHHTIVISILRYIYIHITLLQYIYTYIYIYRPIWVAHISKTYPSYKDHSKDISNLLWSSIPMGFLLSAQVSNESGVRRCPSNDGKKLRSPQTELCMTC